jgi:hypothetical protein
MLCLLVKIFGSKFEDIILGSRKLNKGNNHNMCNLYLLVYKTKQPEMCDTCDTSIRIEVPIQISVHKKLVGQVA